MLVSDLLQLIDRAHGKVDCFLQSGCIESKVRSRGSIELRQGNGAAECESPAVRGCRSGSIQQ